jgi:uncharacterized Zn-finger protein
MTTPSSIVELDRQDLPAYCPNKAMTVWSSHPRVSLDFDEHGHAKCPYCSTQYQLKAGAHAPRH